MSALQSGSIMHRRGHLPTVIAFLAGLLPTVVLFFGAREAEHARLQLLFENQGAEIESFVQSRLASHTEVLQSVAGLYAASKEVDRLEFRQFTSAPLRLYPAIHALAWAPKVKADAVPAYVSYVTTALKVEPGFQIREIAREGATTSQVTTSGELFPVLFVEPQSANQKALGIDLASVSVCINAMRQAAELGTVVAVDSSQLHSTEFTGFDAILFFPVYLKGKSADTPEQRKENLEGIAAAELRFSELMDRALLDLNLRSVEVRLLGADSRVIYHSHAVSAKGVVMSGREDLPIAPWSRPLQIGEQHLRLMGLPTEDFFYTQRRRSHWTILGVGMLFTVLFAFYMHTLRGRAERIHREVERQTALLRQTQERHQIVVQQAADGITLVDAESLRIIEANRAFTRLLGYSESELVGKPISDFIVDSAAGIAARAQLTLDASAPTVVQRQYRRKDGTIVDTEKSATTLTLGGKRVLCTVVHDVTERKRAQQLVEEKNRQLEEAIQKLTTAQAALIQSEKLAGLGQMVAGVAHEINNPLSFVANNVAVLERDMRSVVTLLKLYMSADDLLQQHKPELLKEIAELAERIDLTYTLSNLPDLTARSRDGLGRIQQIVKDLRDFARLDQGDQHDVDLNAGIESTVNIILGRAKKKKVEIVKALNALPLYACHAAKINQVVMNLLANAIDASNDGGKVIIRTEQRNGAIEISVTDSGCGVPQAIRERIFDPFFTTKPPGEGTGLGLSISYGIIRDHGGNISVESELGKGSCFTIHLPLKGVMESKSTQAITIARSASSCSSDDPGQTA